MSPEGSIVAARHLWFFCTEAHYYPEHPAALRKRRISKRRRTLEDIVSAATFLLQRRKIWSAATVTLQFNALWIFEFDGQLVLNRVWHISFLCSFEWNLSNIRCFILRWVKCYLPYLTNFFSAVGEYVLLLRSGYRLEYFNSLFSDGTRTNANR